MMRPQAAGGAQRRHDVRQHLVELRESVETAPHHHRSRRVPCVEVTTDPCPFRSTPDR